jgi:hypothetical protein
MENVLSQNDKIFLDPDAFQEGEIWGVLDNDYQGMLGWFIKWFDKNNYCHAMIMRKKGFVCSQNTLFEEVPIFNYMKANVGLKFFRIANLSPEECTAINTAIDNDLKGSLWSRTYNYLGLFLQATPWKSNFHGMPGQYICSQRLAKYFRMLPRIAEILPPNSSPADEDVIFDTHSDLVPCIGFYWQD